MNLPFFMEWDPISALRLRRAINGHGDQRPVLHAHTAHAAALAALASSGTSIPRVLHRRVDFPLRGNLSRRFKYQRADCLVAVSGAIRDLLIDEGLDSEKIAVVTDGIPLDEEETRWAGLEKNHFFPPSFEERTSLRRDIAARFNIPTQGIWIGNLAALVPHKDHENLIAAALIVLIKKPDTIFLIGGEGPERPRLLKQIERLGLSGKVLLLGQVPDAVSLLKSLDIFALSSWGEGMGSVLLEAAACGIPIAATSAGGIAEIVSDGRSGLLAAPRDPEALAANILKLIDDGGLSRRLSEQARAQLPPFGLRRMADKMENIYETVLARKT